MAKRIRYYYDEESCTFQKERVTAKSILKKVLVSLIVVGIGGYFFLYDNPKEMILKSQNSSLKAEVKLLGESLAILESQVDKLHREDNRLYRSLLNAEPIDDGSWNGGTGGAIEKENSPEVLKQARKRLERLKRKVDIQNRSYDLLYELLSANEDKLKHVPGIKPVPGGVISGFGMRMHPIQKIRKMHWGLDLQASTGTPIYATGDGTVKLVKISTGGYGKQVEIQHGNYGYVSKYAHMSKIGVKQGQKVKRGEIIGYVGNTGLSKGPHLHYEIIRNNKKIDPIDYFYGDVDPKDYTKLRKQAEKDNTSMD